MLDNDPPPNALIAKTTREHRLHRLRSEWRLFPQSRPLIESDIRWHPEWGIAVSGEELIAVAAREPVEIPKSTRARANHSNLDPIPAQTSNQTPLESCSSRLDITSR
jgi:hypothetical protein